MTDVAMKVAPAAPALDAAAAKELVRAVEVKVGLLREVLQHSIAGKLSGVSLSELLKSMVADGNCGNGCC